MIPDKENVTVFIATHNNKTTIKRALSSVTKGIRPANQVVIGDNDSQDGTYDFLCEILGAKPITIEDKTGLPPQFDGEFDGTPIKIFRKRLSTISHTLNVAMQMHWQNVTIFGFMEPESWYAPDKIAQAIRIFQTHQAIACIVSDYDDHHSDGRVERVFRPSFDIQRLLASFEYDGNFLVRPQIFQKMQSGFNEQMPIRHDYDFMLRASEIGLIYHIPAPLHHNKVVENNEDIKQSISQFEQFAKQNASQRRGKTGG
jgi:hypothetical protein